MMSIQPIVFPSWIWLPETTDTDLMFSHKYITFFSLHIWFIPFMAPVSSCAKIRRARLNNLTLWKVLRPPTWPKAPLANRHREEWAWPDSDQRALCGLKTICRRWAIIRIYSDHTVGYQFGKRRGKTLLLLVPRWLLLLHLWQHRGSLAGRSIGNLKLRRTNLRDRLLENLDSPFPFGSLRSQMGSFRGASPSLRKIWGRPPRSMCHRKDIILT